MSNSGYLSEKVDAAITRSFIWKAKLVALAVTYLFMIIFVIGGSALGYFQTQGIIQQLQSITEHAEKGKDQISTAREKAMNDLTKEINKEGKDQKDQITSLGGAKVGEINQESNTQKGLVSGAGTAAVEEIGRAADEIVKKLSGQEVLEAKATAIRQDVALINAAKPAIDKILEQKEFLEKIAQKDAILSIDGFYRWQFVYWVVSIVLSILAILLSILALRRSRITSSGA